MNRIGTFLREHGWAGFLAGFLLVNGALALFLIAPFGPSWMQWVWGLVIVGCIGRAAWGAFINGEHDSG